MHAIASEYLAAGLCVLPAKPTKAPDVSSWTRYQRDLPVTNEVDRWFTSRREVHGLGIVCGQVSHGLEVLDIDVKHAPGAELVLRIEAAVKEFAPGLWERLPIEQTPSGGRHLYFRSAVPEGNLKLARGVDGGAIAETRGEGGFIVASPTPGYAMIQGSLLSIPTLGEDERDCLLAAARSLDESPAQDSRQVSRSAPRVGAELTPLDDFDARGDAIALLRKHGWHVGSPHDNGARPVRRPGKEAGRSATWNRGGRGRLTVYSTSTPFTINPSTHGPAAIYAMLECGGDFSRAASELRRQGFGGARSKKSPSVVLQWDVDANEPPGIEPYIEPAGVEGIGPDNIAGPFEMMAPPGLLKRIEERVFNFAVPPEEPKPRFLINGRPVCTAGNLTTVIAQSKVGKSSYIAAIIAAAICAEYSSEGRDTLGVSATAPSGMRVLHIDTEQSRFDHDQLVRRAIARAGVDGKPAWLRSIGLAGYSPSDQLMTLKIEMERAATDAGVFAVIIDGVADLVLDVNDPAQSNALVAELHEMAIRYNCPIICVIHDNEGRMTNGDGRGHLGKQLMRKAESNLRLEKTNEITVIYSEKMRRAPILKKDGPRFRWSDADGMHVSCETVATSREEEKRERLRDQADAVFVAAGVSALSWSALRAEIAKSEGLSPGGAGKRFDAMKALGVVTKDVVGLWRLAA